MNIADVVSAMALAGCSPEQISDTVAKLTPKRSTAAERQARYRDRQKSSQTVTSDVTERNVTSRDAVSPSPLFPPDKEIPPTPPKEINPPISPQPLSRASRISDDFQPDLDWAVGEGLSRSQAQNEAAKFRDYWIAKAGKDAAKKDWPATWRNWIRSAVERLPRGSPPQKQTMSSVLTNLISEMETANDIRPSQSSLGFEPSVLNLPTPSRQRDA